MLRLALVLVLFPALASAQQLQETITVERVLIDARVTDTHGDPILGLAPDDFVVKLDGKLAKVESVDWIPETAVAREIAGVEKEDVQVMAPASTPDVIAPAGRLFIIFVQTDFGRANVRVRGQMHFMQSAEKVLEMMEPEDRAAVDRPQGKDGVPHGRGARPLGDEAVDEVLDGVAGYA